MRNRGFTLVELVVVIVVMGILAVTVLPRFTDRSSFDQAGFRDQVRAALQHARKTAIASRRNVCVTVSSGGVQLQLDPQLPEGVVTPACSVAVSIPGKPGNVINAPAGVALSASVASFRFDPLGRASVPVTLTVAGQTLTVEQGTGYVN